VVQKRRNNPHLAASAAGHHDGGPDGGRGHREHAQHKPVGAGVLGVESQQLAVLVTDALQYAMHLESESTEEGQILGLL
jgi:hypothetical protein